MQLLPDCSGFIKKRERNTESIILVYVDDLIFISSDITVQDKDIKTFLSHFEGTVERLNWSLGFHISVRRGIMSLFRSSYVSQIIKKFELQECTTHKTPMIANFYDELIHHSDEPVLEGEQYRNMIGALQLASH